MSIPIVRAFLSAKNFFLSSVKNWPKISVFVFWGGLGEMGSKYKSLFLRPPEGTCFRETTSFDILIVQIGAGVLPCSTLSEEPKKLAESLDANFRTFGGQNRVSHRYEILHRGIGVPDVITHAKFSDDRFRGFGGVGVEFPTVPLTSAVVLITLWR